MAEKLTEPLEKFKPREVEIINLMADGLSNKEIAESLFIGTATVRWYNKQIYSKLGTSRRTEAIALAREMGIIGEGAKAEDSKVKHTLPVTTGPFIGRDEEMAELTTLLSNPDIRLISIIATGGMGKSRLALELGHLVKDNYEHGAAFIDLTAVYNPNDIAKQTAAILGIAISGRQDPTDVLVNYCREKELLLIFDNFEHVLEGANLLSELLEAAPDVTIIATTRERLQLRVETSYPLYPVSQSGGYLFVEMARMMRPKIEISQVEKAEVERIVELVGGLPLGLVLAATWVDTLSISEIAEEIEANLDFLSAEMGDVPERQRSIHAVIDPTWNRLSEKEQAAFMWASVFRGGFTRKTFQQVTGASVRTIQTLLGRSLISHSHERRYAMHPLLRQYAREKLEANGNLFEAKKAHLDTFLAYAETHHIRLFDGYYLESLDMFEKEQDNFRGALDWSLAGNYPEVGVSLVLELCRFWAIRSQSIEATRYLEKSFAYSNQAAQYYWLGLYQLRLGQLDEATNNFHQAISLAEKTAEYDMLAMGYGQLSVLNDPEPEEALSMAHRAYETSQIKKTPLVVSSCLIFLGLTYDYFKRDAAKSLDYCQQALKIDEKLGNLRGVSMTTYNISLLFAKHFGDIERAKEYCEYSLTLKRKIGDKAGAARRLSVLANYEVMEEGFEKATAYLAESRSILEEIGEPSRLAFALKSEGFLLLITNRYDQARTVLEKALPIALSSKSYTSFVPINCYLGLLHLLQGQTQQARPYILKAIETTTKSYTPAWESIIAYANFLLHEGKIDRCVEISAVLHLNQDDFEMHRNDNQYFLKPLVYRLRRRIGEAAWEEALAAAEGVTVDGLFVEIVADIQKYL